MFTGIGEDDPGIDLGVASAMGTSRGQITRFESGADTRLSTFARYAAALGVRVEWMITPDPKPLRQQASREALSA